MIRRMLVLLFVTALLSCSVDAQAAGSKKLSPEQSQKLLERDRRMVERLWSLQKKRGISESKDKKIAEKQMRIIKKVTREIYNF